MSDVRGVSEASSGGPAGAAAAAVAGPTGLSSVLYSVTGFTLMKRVLVVSAAAATLVLCATMGPGWGRSAGSSTFAESCKQQHEA
jgi:hypothetical protein